MQFIVILLCGMLAALGCACAVWWGTHLYTRTQQEFQQRMQDQMRQFFLFLDPSVLWTSVLLVSVACAAIAQLLLQFWPATLATGLVCLFLPRFLLTRWRRRRLQCFDQQLPDFLLALAGALRAGAGVQTALRQLVPGMPAPLGQEFALLLREQRMGLGFEAALGELRKRVDTEGAVLMVSALQIAGHSGGNLAETLEAIGQTLRERQQMAGRIRALTAQGRLQAWIMASLPVALLGVLSWLQPHAMEALWTSPQGWMLLGLILALECAGILMVRRIVNIDI